MKLRRNEFCPIHRSVFCCGRERIRKERRVRLGVQRIEDPHHPRGQRTQVTGGNAETAEPEDCRARQKMRHLPRGVYRLQRRRARS
jgi:hypothetical protein